MLGDAAYDSAEFREELDEPVNRPAMLTPNRLPILTPVEQAASERALKVAL